MSWLQSSLCPHGDSSLRDDMPHMDAISIKRVHACVCRYAYMGGFDGTSNVAAAMVRTRRSISAGNVIPSWSLQAFGIHPVGTHAHSLVSAYTGFDDLKQRTLDVST